MTNSTAIDEQKYKMEQCRLHLLHEAMDEYFPGLPHLEQSTENELIFQAGFNAAWKLVEKHHQANELIGAAMRIMSMSGYDAKEDSNNPIESWLHKAEKYRYGKK